MRELELKAVVHDLDGCRARIMQRGASLREAGMLHDRRYDTPDRALRERDVVLRVREFVSAEARRASLDWKGAARFESGYKEREEITLGIVDAAAATQILEGAGFLMSFEIERDVEVYELRGALVRFERYPRMDTLVEVEGEPAAIEAAADALGIPRAEFTTDRLIDFVLRFEERTGSRAALSRDARSDGPYAHVDA